jgi:Mg2+ and Co2+ transporter CorA
MRTTQGLEDHGRDCGTTPALEQVTPILETIDQRLGRVEKRLLLLTQAHDQSSRAVAELKRSVIVLIDLIKATD